VGIPGNERIDEAAKAASSLQESISPPHED